VRKAWLVGIDGRLRVMVTGGKGAGGFGSGVGLVGNAVGVMKDEESASSKAICVTVPGDAGVLCPGHRAVKFARSCAEETDAEWRGLRRTLMEERSGVGGVAPGDGDSAPHPAT